MKTVTVQEHQPILMPMWSRSFFVCQRKKPFIGNATISWYSDSDNNTPIKTETVSVSKAGCYVSVFSKEDGLTTGDYHAYIDISYALGSSKSVANFTIE